MIESWIGDAKDREMYRKIKKKVRMFKTELNTFLN